MGKWKDFIRISDKFVYLGGLFPTFYILISEYSAVWKMWSATLKQLCHNGNSDCCFAPISQTLGTVLLFEKTGHMGMYWVWLGQLSKI